MSYDISLVPFEHYKHRTCILDDEDDCARCATYVDVGNITYNIAPMWADALGHVAADDTDPNPFGAWMRGKREIGIGVFEGAPCVEAAGPLADAVQRMRDNPEHYKAMNPPNGWGNYEGALEFLDRLAQMCVAHPSHRITIS